jgi:hypothetical protein
MLLKPVYDRGLLLHGPKRDKVLTLKEVLQYGIDSFSDPDYVQIFGMAPAVWYRRGIRLLGRTAVECTRDALANRIGRDIASIAAKLPNATRFLAIDPFAGSCNTLYWILRSIPDSLAMACEVDRQVFELTKRNIAGLDRTIDLQQGDYQSFVGACRLPPDHGLIFFIAPPWGTALDEVAGLDLRRTTRARTMAFCWARAAGTLASRWVALTYTFVLLRRSVLPGVPSILEVCALR